MAVARGRGQAAADEVFDVDRRIDALEQRLQTLAAVMEVVHVPVRALPGIRPGEGCGEGEAILTFW
jgi:hypothetical protein